ncbi:hypothetical protein [Vreelandella utahensis]|uniref:hypothetical protein n=1 Tax=Vreelandella halophila TaxID=86177 RepID=UPI0015C3A68F|nr:hypothetical protein [Halomonas utahensis]
MNRRPDVIRVLVVVFATGLLVSGLTSLAASDEPRLTSGAAQEATLTHQGASGRAIN